MTSSQIPSIKEQLADTERAIREKWSHFNASDQHSEAERKTAFEQIAKLEETADELRQKLALSLITNV